MSKKANTVYDKKYFSGKNTFFYKFGYRNSVDVWNSRLKLLLNYKKSGKLLDIGCALGYMLIPFSKHFKVYGTDCSGYAIEASKKNVKKGIFKVHNIEEPLPFRKNSFDVVTCMDVLEHLKDGEALFDNVFNVLKHDGIIFLSTPNYNTLRKFLYYIPDKMEHHLSLYHVDNLVKKMEQHGFDVLDYFTGINFLDKSFWFRSKIGLETLVIARKV